MKSLVIASITTGSLLLSTCGFADNETTDAAYARGLKPYLVNPQDIKQAVVACERAGYTGPMNCLMGSIPQEASLLSRLAVFLALPSATCSGRCITTATVSSKQPLVSFSFQVYGTQLNATWGSLGKGTCLLVCPK